MPSRYDAQIGDTVPLEAQFLLGGDPADVFEIDRVDLLDENLEVVETVDGDDVVQLGTGHYQATFGPLTVSGEFCDHWIYRSTEGGSLRTLVLSVTVTDFGGVAPEVDPDPEPPLGHEDPTPDVDLSTMCKVTHTFITAGGKFMPGVYVRFRPNLMPTQTLPPGTPAREVSAVSDANGELCIYMVRGLTGLLAISGIGLVREVTVPDSPTVDLFDLIPGTQDILEVQDMTNFIDLPRRS